MLDIFSGKILEALRKVNLAKLHEIRLRVARKVIVNIGGVEYFLSNNGITRDNTIALVATELDLSQAIMRAAEYSLYAAEDKIIKGFLTLKNGVRLGLCGEAVISCGKIKTIKNFTSITVRIPHEIVGCSDKIKCVLGGGSVLILSPPGGGKTTMLRDVARVLSLNNNVLILDERYEIAGQSDNKLTFDVGNCDVISGCSKKDGIENGIRACSPDVIVTDEVAIEDYDSIRHAKTCGVRVFASIHGKNKEDLLRKSGFSQFIENKIFDFFVVLSTKNTPGVVEGVFNDLFDSVTYG